jgi:NAD-dependent dihydropyrimidine dehydrogenase PreA subunit
MKEMRYLSGVSTLRLDPDLCVGCGACEEVCPHGVFTLQGGKARIADPDGCMECGACATNCPVSAVSVTPGVGCAAYIIQTWIRGGTGCGTGGGCCC